MSGGRGIYRWCQIGAEVARRGCRGGDHFDLTWIGGDSSWEAEIRVLRADTELTNIR